MTNQLEQTIAKIEALPRRISLWKLVTGDEWLGSDEVVALAAEVKKMRNVAESLVAAFDDRPDGEPLEIGHITREAALNCAKDDLGWPRTEYKGNLALTAEVKRLREGLEHYADESNWSDVHPDVSITPASLYVYEDEFDGAKSHRYSVRGSPAVAEKDG